MDRSASVYPNKPAVIYNDATYTYAEFDERVTRLASALRQAGVGKGGGDRVAFMLPNIPPMLEGHYGPMRLGAILVAINIRLSAREIAYILNHSGAKALVFDSEFADTVRGMDGQIPGVETFVQVADAVPMAEDVPSVEYEEFLASAPDGDPREALDSELDAVSINYTSGTTGMPQGRSVSRARSLPQRAWRDTRIRRHVAQRVPLDAADVPLQRLVPHLGRNRRWRDPHMPAPRGGGRDIPPDTRAWRDEHVRRADRADDALLRA